MFRPPLSRLCFALCLLIGCAAPAYAFDLIQAFEAAQRHSAEYAAAQYGYQAEIEQGRRQGRRCCPKSAPMRCINANRPRFPATP